MIKEMVCGLSSLQDPVRCWIQLLQMGKRNGNQRKKS